MPQETLMTNGAATSQPDASSTGAASTPASASGADAFFPTQQGNDTTSGNDTVSGADTTSGADTSTGADSTADGGAGEETTAGKEGEDALGAPEEYAEFTMPEGITFDPEVGGELKALAKELNLPQDKAQAVADLGVKLAQKFQENAEAQLAEVRNTWADEARADKEIGGVKLAENLTVAKTALDRFASPAFKELLQGSGLGNHPEFIRLFVKVGQAISEDKLVTGNTGGGEAPKGHAENLFPNQKPVT